MTVLLLGGPVVLPPVIMGPVEWVGDGEGGPVLPVPRMKSFTLIIPGEDGANMGRGSRIPIYTQAHI